MQDKNRSGPTTEAILDVTKEYEELYPRLVEYGLVCHADGSMVLLFPL